MLSMGHILIPQNDLKYSVQTDTGVTHFRSGMSSDTTSSSPTCSATSSPGSGVHRLAAGLGGIRVEAAGGAGAERRLTLEDLEDSWDRGIPRINTLFQKDRHNSPTTKGGACARTSRSTACCG